MNWTRNILAGSVVSAATAITAWGSARGSYFPQQPVPEAGDIALWIISGNDPIATSTAVLAAISAGWSVLQMFQARAATVADIRNVVQEHNAPVQDELKLLSTLTQKQQDTLDALYVQLKVMQDTLSARGVSSSQVELFGVASEQLANSGDPEDTAILSEIVNGDPIAAAEHLVEQAKLAKDQRTFKLLNAARILAPFSPSRAIAVYKEALESDNQLSVAWAELARLYKEANLLVLATDSLTRANRTARSHAEKTYISAELAEVMMWEDDRSQSLAGLHRLLEEYDTHIVSGDTEQDDALFNKSTVLMKIGIFYRDNGQLDEAESYFRQCIALRRSLAPRRDLQFEREMVHAESCLGDVAMLRGDFPQATLIMQTALSGFTKILKREPRNLRIRRDISIALGKLSDVEHKQGKFDTALTFADEAMAEAELLFQTDPGVGGWALDFAVSTNKAARLTFLLKDYKGTEKRVDAGIKALEPLVDLVNDEPFFLQTFAALLSKRGEALIMLDDVEASFNSTCLAFDILSRISLDRADDDRISFDLGLLNSTLAILYGVKFVHHGVQALLDSRHEHNRMATEIFDDLLSRFPDSLFYKTYGETVYREAARVV